MKIALIGATGYVGGFVLTEALNREHQVTGITRHPEKLPENKNLTAKKGDVLNEKEVAGLVEGHDAVISAYNPGWGNPEIFSLYLKGTDAIIKGVKASGVKRLLVVGGAGSLEASPGSQLVDSPEFPKEFKDGALAARDALNILKKIDFLDWTFISPSVNLQPGERTGKFRLGTDQLLTDSKGESRISVQDLAVAILDEIEKPRFIRKRFTVGY